MTARGHVLIVDDDPNEVKLLAAILVKERYAISQAYSGLDAIRLASEEAPDVILLDVMMPDIDGFDVTRALKSDIETDHIPIVLVTSMDGVDCRAKGLELGADDVINKPVQRSDLLARVLSLATVSKLHKEIQQQHDLSLIPFSQLHHQPYDKTVLLVESDKELARQLQHGLTGAGYRVLVVAAIEQAEVSIRVTAPDLIMLDAELSGADGLVFLDELKSDLTFQNTPVIVIGSSVDLKSKVDAIERGGDDFLANTVDTVELLARVKACLRRSEAYFHLEKEFKRVKNEALTDSLTQLRNRLYFDTELQHHFELSARHRHADFCLAMIDIDNFKQFNDDYGHLVGDAVLRLVAHILRQAARASDTVARFGGEEFCIILPNTDLVDAAVFAERFRAAVEIQTFQGVDNNRVTISVGLACTLENDNRPEDIVSRADAALYRAKVGGKNRVSNAH